MPSHSRSLIAAAAATLFLCAHVAALAQAAPPPAQSPAVIATLVQQGRYWQTRQAGRSAEAWNKLLAIDPSNADALAGLGRLSLDAKKFADAQRYLARLRMSHPDAPQVAQLEQDIDIASPAGQADLEQAHLLLRERRMDDAAAKYKAIFKGREPTGPLAVEYYGVLGYASGGRDQAIAGLQRILRTTPDDTQAQLSLAGLRLLSEKTRLDAMRTLQALSKRKDIGGDAAEQLRSALGWQGSPPPAAYVPIFREYLAANPDDNELREQLAGRGAKLPGQGSGGAGSGKGGRGGGNQPAAVSVQAKPSPEALHTADGYALIQGKKYDEADAELSAALRINPRFADAAGGMGLLRFKQQRFAEARKYIEEAFRLDGQEGWKILLDTVTYWELLGRADTARTAHRYDEAERILKQAMAIHLEEEDTNAENRLGALYADQKRWADAERVYRHVLTRVPDDALAMSGLINTMSNTGRSAEALALIDNLTPDQRTVLDVNRLRAEQAVGEGRIAQKRGQDAAAREKFRQAVELQPENPWMNLELARLDLRAGARSGATSRMETLLQRHPDDLDTIYTTSLLRGDRRDWAGVLQALDKVPVADRTAAMATLQRSAAIHVQTDQALALAHDGRRADANALLAQSVGRVGDDADLLGIIAQGYVDLGELDRARQLLSGAVERSSRNPANGPATAALQLRYGSVLLAAEDDAGLAVVLRQLQARAQAGQLDADNLDSLDELRRAYVVRQAEALRKQERLADAYELLRPLLAETPQDPMLLSLLARMYNDDGQAEKASAIYRDILSREPDDVNSLIGASGLATLQRNYREADAYLVRAEALAPDNPDVLATRGRLYRAEGRPAKAVDYLRRAAEAVRQRDPVLSATPAARAQNPAGASAYSDNPFAASARSVRSADLPETAPSGLIPTRQAR